LLGEKRKLMDNEKEYNARRIREKMNFFYSEKVAVHIKKYDRGFMNGLLVEKKSDDIFVIDERIEGRKTIFVLDIFDVEELEERGE